MIVKIRGYKREEEILINHDDYKDISGKGFTLQLINRYVGIYKKGKRIEYLHRYLCGYIPEGKQIDHINGNPFDNRKNNLRICTATQNQMNRGKQKNNTSGFKGVVKVKNYNRWFAQIGLNRKKIYLGVFKTPEEASRAYNAAEEKYFKDFKKETVNGKKRKKSPVYGQDGDDRHWDEASQVQGDGA